MRRSFGRLDERSDAVDAHGIGWHIVPGITSCFCRRGHHRAKLDETRAQRFGPVPEGHDMEGVWLTMTGPR